MKKLNIVATPIGNMGDITYRAIDVLKEVDVILCEDTRQTKKILERYEFENKLVSLHQHSSESKIESLLNKYDNIAYVSDAGTPGISDPGGKVVELAYANDFEVVTIPGPSAIAGALSISGLPTDKFLFLGFMPHKGKGKIMEMIKESKITTGFYESPHRIEKTLEQLKEYIADRQIVVCRELTKKFETVYRGSIENIQEDLKVKGEFVVIVSGK